MHAYFLASAFIGTKSRMLCTLDACHPTSGDTLIFALRLEIPFSIFLILHLDGLTRREGLKSLRLLTGQISFLFAHI